MNKKKKELLERIYADLLGSASRRYLTPEELIEAEKHKRAYLWKFKRLGKAARDEKEEIDAVNFVYTTLTTEGVPITREDAGLAYRFSGKKVRNLRDENLQIALDMTYGLRKVRESEVGLSLDFILDLHKLIMAEYGDKHPGQFRKKQAYLFLKSFERTEEIRFRPPAPGRIRKKISELVNWYNQNAGKLNPIELAALLHLRFYMVHPFEDGNKRVSRLLLNKAFFDNSYPLVNISGNTQGYFDALVHSVEKNDEEPFVRFVYEQFLKVK